MIHSLFGMLFVIVGVVLTYSYKTYNKEGNAFITCGEILSRKMNSDGYMHKYYVLVTDRKGEKRKLLSQSFRPTSPLIKIGTKLRVSIVEKRRHGIDTYELKIIDEKYVKPTKVNLNALLLVFAIVCFIVAIGLFLVPIMSL